MSKLQAVNVLEPFSLVRGQLFLWPGLSGDSSGYQWPRSQHRPQWPPQGQGSLFTSWTPVIQPRACEYHFLQFLMERGCLMGQTWHPTHPLSLWAGGTSAVHLLRLSLGLRSYRMGKKLWGKELFSLCVSENVLDYFEDRGHHVLPSSRKEETLLGSVPFLTKPNERKQDICCLQYLTSGAEI